MCVPITLHDTFLPNSHDFTKRTGQVSNLRTENDANI